MSRSIGFAAAALLLLAAAPARAQLACPALPAGAFQYSGAPGIIVRLADNAAIPEAAGNRDYACEQQWEAAGNTPLAAPAPTVAAQYAAKIAAGLAIASTATPALDGTYAIDPASQQKLMATALYIAVNGRFPAGQTGLLWADLAGAPHSFATTGAFQAFATAIGDYVAGLDLAAAQPVPSWPAATATIP